MAGVVSFGDVNVDVVVTVADLPPAGGEVFASASSVRVGGSAANTAVAMAALGLPVTVLATVGADALGATAVGQLADRGVDTGRIHVSDAAGTGTNVVLVTPDGERTMIGVRGVNPSHDVDDWGGEAAWLHVSGYAFLTDPQRAAATRAIERAVAAGMGISVDVPIGVAEQIGHGLWRWLDGRDVVSLGEGAVTLLGGHERLRAGAGLVAVTGGGGPVSVAGDGTALTLSPPMSDATDTTGAGDAFVAGLVAGRIQGLALPSCGVLAVACGTAAARSTGDEPLLTHRSIVDVLDGHRWGGIDPSHVEAVRSVVSGGSA